MTIVSRRQRMGCWIYERWRVELVLRLPKLMGALGMSWLDFRNRGERLSQLEGDDARRCLWADSSQLTVSRIFPDVGKRILRHALQQWPIRFQSKDVGIEQGVEQVSILIPIGGNTRLAQFELALAAARAQTGVVVEIIVIEQSPSPTLSERLPNDVRYVHQPQESPGRGFNKSMALNLGAQLATAESLIILDADYLLPEKFASECHRKLQSVEGVRPVRLLFYLDRESTEALVASMDLSVVDGLEKIVANNPTPIAVRRSTYWAIGGHDEAYFGWGGEDSEFLDRLRTRKVSEAGWMLVIHAWHAPALKKTDGDRNREVHAAIVALPARDRISKILGQALNAPKERNGNCASDIEGKPNQAAAGDRA